MENKNLREKLNILIFNEPLKKSDAIILLTGDGNFRLAEAIYLYKQKWAPKIVVSGGTKNINYGSFHSVDFAKELIKRKISSKNIIIDEKSQNTREQAINIMQMAKAKKWKKILLVASPHHQLRAFLTFLKAKQEVKIKLQIINSPAQNLPWFEKNKWGKRFDWLEPEAKKIKKYKKHMADFPEAIFYQEWKEKQK